MRPSLVLHGTEAACKTNYSETEIETERMILTPRRWSRLSRCITSLRLTVVSAMKEGGRGRGECSYADVLAVQVGA